MFDVLRHIVTADTSMITWTCRGSKGTGQTPNLAPQTTQEPTTTRLEQVMLNFRPHFCYLLNVEVECYWPRFGLLLERSAPPHHIYCTPTSGRPRLHRIIRKKIQTRRPTRITHLPLRVRPPHTHTHHLPLRPSHAATHQHRHNWHPPPSILHQALHYEERGCAPTRLHTTHRGYTPRSWSYSTLKSRARTRRASGT